MNILFYAYDGFNPNHGGIERVSNNLARAFRERGDHVFFVSWRPYEFETPTDDKIILPDQHQIDTELNTETFVRFVEQHEVELIICQHSYFKDFSSFVSVVKNRTGAKLLYAFHTTPDFKARYIAETSWPILPSQKTFFKHYKRLTRALLKKQKQLSRNRKMGVQIKLIHDLGDGVVFLSEKYIPMAMKMAGISSDEKLFAAANPNTFRTEDRQWVFEKDNILLFVGRLSSEKRPEKAMRLWQNIQSKFPDWSMKILGDGVLMNDLQFLQEKMRLERFTLEGYQDPAKYYEKAKILLVPSDFEGFGMSIVEAQQYGVVPFTFDTYAAISDIIIDDETGVVIPPYKLKQFETRLTSLMRDEQKLKSMSAKARKMSEKFDMNHVLLQWDAIFKSIGLVSK